MATCLAAIKIRDDSALESWTQGEDRVNIRWHHGDPLLEKREGMFRHVCPNVGNFTVENEDGAKLSDPCEVMSKHDMDAMSLSEHGLNPPKLNPTQTWSNRLKGQFQHERSGLAHNEKWTNPSLRMWGGTDSEFKETCVEDTLTAMLMSVTKEDGYLLN